MNKLLSTAPVRNSNGHGEQFLPGTRPGLVRFVILTISFLLLASCTITRWKSTWTHPYRQIELRGQWIQPPDNATSGYFRKRFDLTGAVRHAWIMVAAREGFEVTVNRNPVGRQYLWRPTRPFQTGTSEKGQRVISDDAAMALNFPREYQWAGHQNTLLPTFLDISNDFRIGNNVVCVEIESRSAPASVNLFGEITLWDGRVIPIRSDETWKSEPVPPGPQLADWTETEYWDKSWRNAQHCDSATRSAWRTLPPAVFTEPFRGAWMQAASACRAEPIHFTTRWFLESEIDEAWIRVVANRRYELFVNDQRVSVSYNRPPDLDHGEWVLGRDSALDPVSRPEMLDPDEVGDFFGGKQFENPRDAQADLEQFIRLKPKTHLPFRNYKTTNRAEAGGEFDPTRTLAESRRTPASPDLPAERPIANSLKRDRAIGGYLAYSIRRLLHPGWNKVEIRCVPETDFNWPTRIAVDGMAHLASGQQTWLPRACDWRSIDPVDQLEYPVQSIGPVHMRGKRLPRMQYRGIAKDPGSVSKGFSSTLGQVSLAALFAVLLFVVVARVFAWVTQPDSTAAGRGKWSGSAGENAEEPGQGESAGPGLMAALTTLSAMMLVASVTLLCGMLLEMSLQERHEVLWFQRGVAWQVCFALSAVLAVGVGAADILGRCGMEQLRDRGHRISDSLRCLPETRLWPYLILWVVLLSVLLRAYKLEWQPLDDDEYASTQAITAILETGVPEFQAEDVYYTRSPLYHYLTAALAYPFGGNLWSLRLQSVLWSVATILLAYCCGSHLLNSRWIGFAAMVLLAIHPFEVFTGHVIRFYQMQQFFALLTIYMFCRGFVTEQQQSFRIGTVLIFLCAVLSQEISAVMGVPLLLGYALFAKDLGWTRNVQLIIVSMAVVLIIAVDLLAFQTLCLTRTEGVSPSMEASIKPHFWYPLNLFSVFIGYSRLHIIPSFFLFAGLPLIWREKNRNALALVMFLLSGVLMTNLLVSHVSLRYQYWLFPVWILVSLLSIRLIMTSMVQLVYQPRTNLNRYVTTLGTLSAAVFAAIVFSWSPWRFAESYDSKLLGDSTGCVRRVKSQMRPGDKLAITEPHTHAAFLETGQVDYDIAIPLLYDFAVFQDGRLVDRNGGGELVSSLDDLVRLFEKEDRIWILLNREKFRTRGKNMRWEYPGSRFETFVRQNCELKHRTYLWHAYLWDSRRGHYVTFSKQQ